MQRDRDVDERKALLLRLDPAVHDGLARWAADELRSTNAQIEYLLRRALAEAARLPAGPGRPPQRGRPPPLPDGTAMDTDGAARDGDEAELLPGAGRSAREGPHESGR